MATPPPGTVLQHLRDQFAAEQTNRLPDGQLLQRFAHTREETAFDALVRRHGPLVLGVCRRVLHDWHDAEDAFQATFLVLARNAGSIRKGESLGSWLYGTAYRVAVKARGRTATRQRYESRAEPRPAGDPLAEVTGRELLTVLDEELQRLPERYRAPLVLCYLEGQTCDEAARSAGCSTRTLKRRLDQARDRLRARLQRRGLALSGALLSAGLTQGVAAAVSPTLHRSAVRSAIENAAAPATNAAATLARGFIHNGAAARFRVAAYLLIGLVALGVGLFTYLNALPPEQDAPAAPSKAAAVPPREQDEGKIRVTGRILDAAGKPLKDVVVAVLTLPKDWDQARGEFGIRLDTLARALTGPKGEFTVRVPPPSGKEAEPSILVARAPGHGLNWIDLKPGADKAAVELRLPPERILRGRVIDLQGQPVEDLPVHVLAVMDGRKDGMKGVMQPADRGRVWLPPVRTDAQGRFQLHGLGANHTPFVEVQDDRYQRDPLSPWKTDKERSEEITLTLAPAKFVVGRVTYADTGKPAVKAVVQVANERVLTDKDGRYRVGAPKDQAGANRVMVQSPAGEPYLNVMKFVKRPKGAARQEAVDLSLPRAVVVRGRVAEAGSGKPVAGAVVYFIPRRTDNPFFLDFVAFGAPFGVRTAKDGTYTLHVLPGPGHLLVKAPAPDYLLHEFGMNQLFEDRPGGQRWYAHGHRATNFKPADEPKDADIPLRRGVTVRGKVVGPDGQPAPSAEMLTRPLFSVPRFIEEPRGERVPPEGFAFGSCDPDKSYRVVFLDLKNHWGATVELAGKDADKPLTVRLQPCGKATARFVNGEGKPLENYWPEMALVLSPGPHPFDPQVYKKGMLAADAVNLANVHPRDYQMRDARTDAQGHITLPDLVPGVTYRIASAQMGGKILREFTVRPGETLNLKDITVSRDK